MNPEQALFGIRLLHTLLWFMFAGAILALPVAALANAMPLALWLAAIAGVEVAALLANRMRCPLRDLAARYTTSRDDGFDIFLPGWLAARTKAIFTPILILGVSLLVWRLITG